MPLLWVLLETVPWTKWPLYVSFLFLVSWWFASMTSQGGNRFSPGTFKYQLWEELFLFQGYVIALGVDGSILRNTKYLSSILVPIYGIGPTTSYESSWALRGSLGGKVLARILIVRGNKNQFPGPPSLVPALLGWSGMMFVPSYSSAFTPLCLFHCWKTQNITFLVHIVCLKIHLETCPIWKWLKLQKKHSCL